MNFLAHLHIADYCQSDLAGNLLGDFVKGNPDTQFPAPIAKGIRLHRFVDSFTDAHPLLKQAKLLFPAETKRFSPIALDVFFDHCLATYWSDFHHLSLNDFCQYAQAQTHPSSKALIDLELEIPERYTLVIGSMWQGQWIESYKSLANIEFALQRMSSRSLRMAPLADCFETIEAKEKELKALFLKLYPLVLQESLGYRSEILPPS